MKKISLVELSQMEVKPRKIIFKNEEFRFLLNDGYRSNFRFKLDDYILFEELNEPLIEIEEEPLLTDEERAYLKMCIEFCEHSVKQISKFNGRIDMYCDDVFLDSGYSFNYGRDFKNLESKRKYTLEELGLEE